MRLNFDMTELLETVALQYWRSVAQLVATIAAIAIVLLAIKWLPRLHAALPRPQAIALLPPKTPKKRFSAELKDNDSGYEGSDIESVSEDSADEDIDPQCGGSADEDERAEKYALRRAIRMCQKSATPLRTPKRSIEEDFATFSSFLSATERKVKEDRRCIARELEFD